VTAIKGHRVFEEDLARDPARWVVSFSMGMAVQLDAVGCLSGASALWSMWPGYLQGESGKRLTRFLEEREIPLAIEHTSGHASISDLQRLVASLSPTRVVPIHSFGAEGFDDLFDGVEHHDDGEWWAV
jgi:ribonuclease J